MLLFSVFAGGVLGTVARYAMGGWVQRRLGPGFPWGTMSVNMLGSLLLGLLLPFFDMYAPLTSLRGFVTVGCIGAFTTYSTFALETVNLIHDGEPRRAALYVGMSVLLGLLLIAVGLAVSQRLIGH